MKRRSFLRALLGSAVAAHELDIEKLLWVPGQKTIFVPPVSTLPPFELDNTSIIFLSWHEGGVRVYQWRGGDPFVISQRSRSTLDVGLNAQMNAQMILARQEEFYRREERREAQVVLNP